MSLVAVATSGCGGHKAASPTVQVAFNKKLNEQILVDSRGFTLYLYTADNQSGNKYKPTCYDDATYHCSKVWLPLRAEGVPRAGPGAKAQLLGTVKRTDGIDQVTYNGHPLYTDEGPNTFGLGADKKPGDAYGEGFVGIWYVLSPTGEQLTH